MGGEMAHEICGPDLKESNRIMGDRILRGWTEIESITPWADTPDLLRRRDGQWLRDNGYVLKDKLGERVKVWTWESLLKAGLIMLSQRKQVWRQRGKTIGFE